MSEMIVLLVPLLGTTLGAAMVFLMCKEMNARLEKALLGFAAGVMIAASVWSLLIPSIDMAAEQGVISWVPALVGFLLGIVFLLLIDTLTPHLHLASDKPEGVKSGFSKTTMMLLAVTIHNIPEGMAVGVAFAGAVVNEAMNSGCAVAACGQAGAVPYLIQNGENGFIFKKNYEELLQEVTELVKNPELRMRMAKAANETITTCWNAEHAASELLRVIKEVQMTGKLMPAKVGPLSRA